MRKPQGILTIFDPDPQRSKGQVSTRECDTFTCSHCGKVVLVPVRCDPADAGGLCHTCAGLICGECVGRGVCDPLEEKLRRAEARGIALRSYGMG